MHCHFLLWGIFPTQGFNPPAGRFFITEPPGASGNPQEAVDHCLLSGWHFVDVISYDDHKNQICYACVCAHSVMSLTLCSPMDCSLPGSSVHGCSRQEYWSGLPFPSPVDLSNRGIEPTSLASSALAGGFVTTSTTWEAQIGYGIISVLEWNWGCVCVYVSEILTVELLCRLKGAVFLSLLYRVVLSDLIQIFPTK